MSGKTFEKHKMEYLPIVSIVPNTWNVQDQDQVTFDRLTTEIADIGFIDPLEVIPMDNGLFRILGGEHRWMAAKKLGMDEVPCIVLSTEKWQEEDLQKFVTVRLNTIKGKLDPHKFAALHREMAEKYGEEALAGLMGFTDQKAFEKLLKGVSKGMKQALPKEMADKFDEAAKDAKSVEDLGNIIQTLFAQYGDTVQQNFIIFTYGKREHIYVAMDKTTRKAMDKVVEYCRVTGSDINALIGKIAQEWMKEAESRLNSLDADSNGKKPNDSGEIEGADF